MSEATPRPWREREWEGHIGPSRQLHERHCFDAGIAAAEHQLEFVCQEFSCPPDELVERVRQLEADNDWLRHERDLLMAPLDADHERVRQTVGALSQAQEAFVLLLEHFRRGTLRDESGLGGTLSNEACDADFEARAALALWDTNTETPPQGEKGGHPSV